MIYYGKCNLCSEVIRKNGLDAYNMRQHLRAKHPREYLELREADALISEAQNKLYELADKFYEILSATEYEKTKEA